MADLPEDHQRYMICRLAECAFFNAIKVLCKNLNISPKDTAKIQEEVKNEIWKTPVIS